MNILSAKFIISNTELSQCPKPDKPELAFIGRSNVGKSSLINMICGKKGLAKTSSTPGKTQLINHFLINESWYLVDLPGYGYAKVSKSKRANWDKFVKEYLLKRTNLVCVFVLIDVRIPPQKIDLEFMQYLGEKFIPFAMVFTKSDSLGKTVLAKNLAVYKREMLKSWHELPINYVTSSKDKTGKEEFLNYLGELIEVSK